MNRHASNHNYSGIRWNALPIIIQRYCHGSAGRLAPNALSVLFSHITICSRVSRLWIAVFCQCLILPGGMRIGFAMG